MALDKPDFDVEVCYQGLYLPYPLSLLCHSVPPVCVCVCPAQVAVIPPAPFLPIVQGLLAGTRVKLGAQDIHPQAKGAFTGAVSVGMVKSGRWQVGGWVGGWVGEGVGSGLGVACLRACVHRGLGLGGFLGDRYEGARVCGCTGIQAILSCWYSGSTGGVKPI